MALEKPTLNPLNQDLTSDGSEFNKKIAFVKSNKGIIIAIAIGAVVIILGVTSLFSIKSTNQYQGLIQKVEQQTLDMNSN